MKKLMLILLLGLGTAPLVYAQDEGPPRQTPVMEDQDREKIEISKLPQAVRTALESEDYANWTVSSAYRSTQTESIDETVSMEIYVVEMKNGADTQVVKFDKDGNKVDEEIEENRL